MTQSRSVSESPSANKIRALLDSIVMRSRLVVDRIAHRPPPRSHLLDSSAETCAMLFKIPHAVAQTYWDEIVNRRLEADICAELALRVTKTNTSRLIAQPSGKWLDILRVIYVLVRALKPERVVETGVGPVGSTTAFVLEAMRVNDSGHLWSIDSNRYGLLYGMEVGSGVSHRLTQRHSMVLGDSREELGTVLGSCERIQLFIHDGDHSYSNMKSEFHQAWNYLSPRGYLVADDVNNSAIDEVSSQLHGVPSFLSYGPTQVGFLEKTVAGVPS